MTVDAEEVQELGRTGVAMVKRWLEATTFIELNWNVYENPALCIVPCLGNKKKKFDLAGSFIGLKRSPVVVESKRYSTVGNQHKYFKEFLAIAYSSTQYEIAEKGSDISREFIWVTTHPFSQGDWPKLLSEEKIKEALDENADYLGGDAVEPRILRKVSERVWVLVMHEKQQDITLTHEELMKVLVTLRRKTPTL